MIKKLETKGPNNMYIYRFRRNTWLFQHIAIAIASAILFCSISLAQTPDIEITVNTSPGGKGRVVAFDFQSKTLLVELALPSGRTTTVPASRGHVAPSAWRTVTELLASQTANKKTDSNVTDAFEAGVATARQPNKPVVVRTTFGDQGILLGFDADSNSARVDFQGRIGRPLPIQQLNAESWKTAQRQLARQLRNTKR